MDRDLTTLLNQAIDRMIVNAKQPLRRKDGKKTVCYYCGRHFDSQQHKKDVDHITPLHRGGIDAAFNKAIICSHCNYIKNSKHPVYWLMEGRMHLDDDLLLDWLARVLYHSLTVCPEPEPVF